MLLEVMQAIQDGIEWVSFFFRLLLVDRKRHHLRISFHLDGPATIDKLHKMMLTNSAQYLFQ